MTEDFGECTVNFKDNGNVGKATKYNQFRTLENDQIHRRQNKTKQKTEHHLSRWYKSKTEASVIFWIGVILIFPPFWALWLGNPEKNMATQLTEKTALLWALVKTPLAPLQNTLFIFFPILEASRKNYFHNPLAIWFDSQFSSGKTKGKPTYRVSPKTVEITWNNSAL